MTLAVMQKRSLKRKNMGHHIFHFVEISSYVTLISGRSIKLLFFVLVKKK